MGIANCELRIWESIEHRTESKEQGVRIREIKRRREKNKENPFWLLAPDSLNLYDLNDLNGLNDLNNGQQTKLGLP